MWSSLNVKKRWQKERCRCTDKRIFNDPYCEFFLSKITMLSRDVVEKNSKNLGNISMFGHIDAASVFFGCHPENVDSEVIFPSVPTKP